MKDCFIIESKDFVGVSGFHEDIIVVLNSKEKEMETICVNEVKFALDFVICEREIPSFYK